ncbi:MAG: molybdopterin-dependent oxidoreductase [Anaerolineae bacterium]
MKRIPFTCTLDCGSRCELVACVEDGRLVRIDTPTGREDSVQFPRLIPCVRGRAHRRVLEAPERLLHPLIHSGTRGAGFWREAPWDEALDLVACRLSEALAQHGPASILHATGAGSLSGRGFTGASASQRFFSYWAPVTDVSGNMSVHNIIVAQQWMLGRHLPGSDRATLLDSRLILLWGHNPAETHMGPNTAHFVAEARDRGAHVVLLDPRLTDSGVLADEWIPLRPGTDAALAAAMAWVIVNEGLHDGEFVARCVDGFEAYRGYLFGQDDGVAKTPGWAEPITGVPAETILVLARRYATDRPAALLAGWGPQRALFGEQAVRALIALACVSGNVGLRGGGVGGYGTRGGDAFGVAHLPTGPYKPVRRLPPGSWAPLILEDQLRPRPAVLYSVASNLVNRSQSSLACLAALERVPFVIVQDPFMTPTARHADVVLPVTMDLERSDLVTSWGHDSHLFDSQQAIEPAGESHNDYWVMARLAERLGFGQQYTQGRTEEEWLAAIKRSTPLPWPQAAAEGILRRDPPPREELEAFRTDPVRHRLSTRSGRIELANAEAIGYGLPLLPAYIPSVAPPGDYPLQLLTPHHKTRSNSCLAANRWLQQVEPHGVCISAADARERGIAQGDMVLVSSPSGTIRIRARVTEGIMPGVVSVPQGTWVSVDADGIDIGGCANTLTGLGLSPTGGPATHTAWVQVERTHD